MEEKTSEQLLSILRSLRENNSGVEGAALTSTNGFLLAQDFAEEISREKALAVVAALLRLGKKNDAARENGGFGEMQLKGAESSIMLYRADGAVLAVRISPEANAGMIALEARQAAAEIGDILSRELPANYTT